MDLVPYLSFQQVEGLLHGAALLAGASAFVVGLVQYVKAQAWKRHEFVAAEVRDFNANPSVRNAMLMIDWGTRDIELFPAHTTYESRFVLVTRPLLHAALTTHDQMNRPFTREEAAIRDCFDAFFGGLERFEQFVNAKLVDAKEFQPYLAYWVRAIGHEANPVLRGVLNDYVVYYRFESVKRLFERLGVSFGATLTRVSSVARQEALTRYETLVHAGQGESPSS